MSLLVGADPAVCDRDRLASLVRDVHRVRAWIAAFENRISARATELARQGECESAGTVLGNGGRRSARDAEAAARRGSVCSKMPVFQEALESGQVSSEHVDVVGGLVRGLDESAVAEVNALAEALVQSAAAMPVETFARECRDLERILSRDEGVSRLAQLRQQCNVRRWVAVRRGCARP